MFLLNNVSSSLQRNQVDLTYLFKVHSKYPVKFLALLYAIGKALRLRRALLTKKKVCPQRQLAEAVPAFWLHSHPRALPSLRELSPPPINLYG
jgi:hypothetical protein